jgi:hypothetical protein
MSGIAKIYTENVKRNELRGLSFVRWEKCKLNLVKNVVSESKKMLFPLFATAHNSQDAHSTQPQRATAHSTKTFQNHQTYQTF